MNNQAVVAAGHEQTANTAAEILNNGGNAFDAMIAAFFTACVAEPILASVAGGGFMLTSGKNKQASIYDFFCQTPQQKKAESELHFYPISADFGNTSQCFHIGMGSVATPGCIRGMYQVHKDLASMPMHVLLQPAIELARNGVKINSFQSYIFEVISPILLASDSSKLNYQHPELKRLYQTNEVMKQSAFANFLGTLATQGENCFYQGDIAHLISDQCHQHGGHLTINDLQHYQVIKRKPLEFNYRHTQIQTNPPPSSGGTLIGLALKLLESQNIQSIRFHDDDHLQLLSVVMELCNQARKQAVANPNSSSTLAHLLDDDLLKKYQTQIAGHFSCSRGTTHISIIDKDQNLCGLTVSNGEGCGYMLEDTGIMLNNMLGEDDLNPGGFHRWPTDQRLTSMMSPGILHFDETHKVVFGSGGSNRIRTALTQVISNLVDFNMNLEDAIKAYRTHFEHGIFNIEYLDKASQWQNRENIRSWDEINLFFGGVHAASVNQNQVTGFGDPRRGGQVVYCT